MAGQCCMGGRPSRRLARRISGAAASMLPGAALVFLPKCPLCLAAWLTVVTGLGFSAGGAAWVRGMLVVFWVAVVALVSAPIVRRHAFGRVPDSSKMAEQDRNFLSSLCRPARIAFYNDRT